MKVIMRSSFWNGSNDVTRGAHIGTGGNDVIAGGSFRIGDLMCMARCF